MTKHFYLELREQSFTMQERLFPVKASLWNYFLPLKSNDYILFNINTRTILNIDEELKEILRSNRIEKLDSDTQHQLLRLGVLTDKDEIAEYKLNYFTEQYSSPHSTFIIFPTYSCNLSCEYCYQRQAGTPTRSMSKNEVEACINFIKHQTIKDRSRAILIKFFGGEPLVRSDICLKISKDLQNWCTEEGIQYFGTITTNGTLLHGKTFQDLVNYLGAVHITLDGDKNFHNTKRFYKKDHTGTYEDIMTALQLLKEHKIFTTLRINIHKGNINGLKSLLEDLARRGLNNNTNLDLDFGLVLPEKACGRDFDSDYYIDTKKEVVDFTKILSPIIQKTGWENIARVRIPDDINDEPMPVLCDHTKRKRYIIDSNGDLYLCPSRSGEKRYQVGKLNDDGTPIWNDTYYKILSRTPIDFPQCMECVFLPLCGSGCAIHAFEANGTFNNSFCGAIKEITPMRIKSYINRQYPGKYEFL